MEIFTKPRKRDEQIHTDYKIKLCISCNCFEALLKNIQICVCETNDEFFHEIYHKSFSRSKLLILKHTIQILSIYKSI